MFNKILIANRGEIALRVIRAARKLGIKTVAVYSDADRDALHVQNADESYCIGPGSPLESYLSIPNIMSALEISKAEAVHPGYGFLSENVSFAEICESYDIKFIGPSPRAIKLMGDKAQARAQMQKTGVPVTPGSPAAFLSAKRAVKFIKENTGFPVLIKAAAGGGGRGMRLVTDEKDFDIAFATARNEAEIAFGNGALYIEKYLKNPKHVEIQILGDLHGNVVHLGERDCSVQRRHQKLIEESPCSTIAPETRKKLQNCAVTAAKAINYHNAGTFEFLLDENGDFYFMELNTRLQVEHGVTEMVLQVDIVEEQLRVAAGEKLGFTQEELKPYGSCLECRINAEDPKMQFCPSPGKITTFLAPGGPFVRLDTAAHQDYVISPFYDSMIAKLLVWGRDRKEAITRMHASLKEFQIDGIKTTIPLFIDILENNIFQSGEYGTKFLDGFLGN
ncbi:acetyl-CoA carboxylase biotin carboxylase subunit [Candidatus Riflebacteria bacterium]